MKFLLTSVLSLFAFGAFAADDLNSMKSAANEKIDEQITKLNSSRTCVNGATTVDAFKSCKVESPSTTIQREEETTRTVEKKDFGDKTKEQFDEAKDKVDDAL